MKYSLIVVTFLTSIYGSFGQIDNTEKFNKLKIVLINSSDIVISNGIFTLEDSKSSMTILNEKGLIIESKFADIRGHHITTYEYKYGKCDDYEYWAIIEEKDNKIDTTLRQKIIFDNNCKIKEIVWLDSLGNIVDTKVCEYNEKSKIITEIDRNNKGELTASVYYSYPDELTTVKKAFMENRSFWYHTQVRCDKKGNIIETTSFDKDGNSTNEKRKTECIYKDDRLVQKIDFNSEEKIVGKTLFSYNSDGLLDRQVRNTFEEDGETETITIIKYIKRR